MVIIIIIITFEKFCPDITAMVERALRTNFLLSHFKKELR